MDLEQAVTATQPKRKGVLGNREDYPLHNPALDELVGNLADIVSSPEANLTERCYADLALGWIEEKETGTPALSGFREVWAQMGVAEIADYARRALTIKSILRSGVTFEDNDLEAILLDLEVPGEEMRLREEVEVEYLIDELDRRVLGDPPPTHHPLCALGNIPPQLEEAIADWFHAIRRRKGEDL